jgi:hypothetical protein
MHSLQRIVLLVKKRRARGMTRLVGCGAADFLTMLGVASMEHAMTWTPFRPTPQDMDRIAGEVAAIPAMQQQFRDKAAGLKVRDRVAHQYQIAGSRVSLRIASRLPANLDGVGLFVPDADYVGLARLSTGLGCPHLETDPDFIGMMLAFATCEGQRIDFLGINDPTAPSPNHRAFMTLMQAAIDGTAATAPLIGGLGKRNLPDLLYGNTLVMLGLIRRMGFFGGLRAAAHALAQTARSAVSHTAYQTFWGGIVEAGGSPGKMMVTPDADENAWFLRAGARHLTEEWRQRQAHGPVHFNLHWLPYIDERATPTDDMTRRWEERPELIGRLTFPQADLASEEARLWAALTVEMGATPAHWAANARNDIAEPGTAFGVARKIAYQMSQQGRGALPEALYAHVFQGSEIGEPLATELRRRRAAKLQQGHVDMAP